MVRYVRECILHDKNPHADGQSIRSGAANRLDLEALTAVASSIRILSMDAVEASGTGHPGMPLGCAATTSRWTR